MCNKLKIETKQKLDSFYQQCEEKKYRTIGYPVAIDFDSSNVKNFLDFSMNNCGDWADGSNYELNTFEFEKEIIEYFAEKFDTNINESWGYVTTGGTEGNIWGCYLAREKFPNGVLYYSDNAHYSIIKIVRLLNVKSCMIKTNHQGEMDYQDLKEKIVQQREHNPIIFCSIGTTVTGAIDDIDQIKKVVNECGFTKEEYYLHADCAFSGMILPFVDNPKPFKFSDGVDSIAVSGHKMIGSPIPCGVALAKKSLVDKISSTVEYIDAKDTTITGSRNAISCLHLWNEIKSKTEEEKRNNIQTCLMIAQETVDKLNELGVRAWRNLHSVTVVFPAPSKEVWKKYGLATAKDLSHIIITGYSKEQMNYLQAVINELAKDSQ